MPKADNLTSCAVVMKSGNLNFLEPSEPPQACNGTALPCTCVRDIHIYFRMCITSVISGSLSA